MNGVNKVCTFVSSDASIHMGTLDAIGLHDAFLVLQRDRNLHIVVRKHWTGDMHGRTVSADRALTLIEQCTTYLKNRK
jgi:hypothetical protein